MIWRRALSWLGRGLLFLLVLLLALTVPLLSLLGSEAGSRWLIERGLGVQQALTLKVEEGDFLNGLTVSQVHLHTPKFDLYIQRLMLRWSLLGLLRAQVTVSDLQAAQVRLVLTGPPSRDPVKLPRLVLPLDLIVEHAELHGAGIEKKGRYVGLEHALLRARWRGSRVAVRELKARHARLGELKARGAIRLIGQYDIDVAGQLSLLELERQGLTPLQFSLGRHLGSLALTLDSQDRLPAHVEATLQTLTPDLPFSAHARWQGFKSPWLAAQRLQTTGGELQASGSLLGLRSLGRMALSGAQVPAGEYRWRLSTDWRAADIEQFAFKGLGGELSAQGRVAWQQGIAWKIQSDVKQLKPAQKWPALASALPPALSGRLESEAKLSATGSTAALTLKLAQGERWALKQSGQSWPWRVSAPQDARLEWAGVQRQLPGLGLAQSRAGTASFSGSLKGYRLGLEADFASAKTPQGLWRLRAQGQERRLGVELLDYSGEVGAATFAGELAFESGLRWEGALTLNNLQSAWLLPAWPGSLSGSLNGRGQWSPGRREVQLEHMQLAGFLREQPLTVAGNVQLALPLRARAWPRARVQGLKLAWGNNTVDAEGGLGEGWDLALNAGLVDLQQLDARLAGSADLDLRLSGAEREPSAQLLLSSQGLAGFGVAVESLHVDGQLNRLGLDVSQLNLQAQNVSRGQHTLDSVSLSLNGSREQHSFSWVVQAPQGQAQGRLAGALDSQTWGWRGALEVGQLSLPDMLWVLDQPAALSWSPAERNLRVSAHCWSSGAAKLCNEDELVAGPAGHVKLRLTGLEAARLQRFMPEGLHWAGELAGNGDASWAVGEEPELRANLLAQNGQISLARDEGEPLRLGYTLMALQAFIRPEDWRFRYDLLSEDMGNGYIDVTTSPKVEGRPLKGVSALKGMRLDILQPFFPALATLSGNVSAEGEIGGVLQRPEFNGSVVLDQGVVVARDLPVNLHEVSLRADVAGPRAVISGGFLSGEGKASITGDADWAEQWRLRLALEGKQLDVVQEPLVKARIDPSLRLAVVPGSIDLRGLIRVPQAKITIESLPERAVAISPDVVIVRRADDKANAQLQRTMQAWAINADIELLLGEAVDLNGFGVIGQLDGALRLQQQGKRGLQATGELSLADGARYDAYGQKLQIRRGRLLFAGSLTQPGVDVEAIREVDSKVVGLRVSGRANAPEVSFFSDSGLNQEEILSYLILGQPLYKDGQLNTGEGNSTNLALASAAIKLGSKGGGQTLASEIGGLFGFQDVNLGAEGTGDDTQVTVSGYLNPKLFLSYGVGVFTPVNTVKLRYTINRKLYLQAVSSLENAIDLFYSFRF